MRLLPLLPQLPLLHGGGELVIVLASPLYTVWTNQIPRGTQHLYSTTQAHVPKSGNIYIACIGEFEGCKCFIWLTLVATMLPIIECDCLCLDAPKYSSRSHPTAIPVNNRDICLECTVGLEHRLDLLARRSKGSLFVVDSTTNCEPFDRRASNTCTSATDAPDGGPAEPAGTVPPTDQRRPIRSTLVKLKYQAANGAEITSRTGWPRTVGERRMGKVRGWGETEDGERPRMGRDRGWGEAEDGDCSSRGPGGPSMQINPIMKADCST